MEYNSEITGTQRISQYTCNDINCNKMHHAGGNFEVQVYGEIIMKPYARIMSNGIDKLVSNDYFVPGNGGNIEIEANNICMDDTNKIEAICGKNQLNGTISLCLPKYRYDNLIYENVLPNPILL